MAMMIVGANAASTRVLFYLTFRHPAADAADLGNEDAHSILPEFAAMHISLGDLRTSGYTEALTKPH